jgi:hypothetical protein
VSAGNSLLCVLASGIRVAVGCCAHREKKKQAVLGLVSLLHDFQHSMATALCAAIMRHAHMSAWAVHSSV